MALFIFFLFSLHEPAHLFFLFSLHEPALRIYRICIYLLLFLIECDQKNSCNDYELKTFGEAGKGNGQFKDLAGMQTDEFGNMFINDAGNHRLQIFDKNLTFRGILKTKGFQLNRPSGLILQRDQNCLYILNLRDSSMIKCRIIVTSHQNPDKPNGI